MVTRGHGEVYRRVHRKGRLMSHFDMRGAPLTSRTDRVLLAVIVICLVLLWWKP